MKIKNMFKKKLKYDYKALVFIPSVDSMQAQTSVETILIRDKEDNLLYLVDNVTKGARFKELFPGENKKIFSKDELSKLKQELNTLRNKKKNTSKDSIENPLNIDKKIYSLETLIKRHEEPKGTFVIQAGGGVKNIYYLRKSTGLEAIHFDIHNNSAYSPTETQSRDAFNEWKNKYEQLKAKPNMPFEKVTATIAAVVLVLLILAAGVYTYKVMQHESDLANARVQAQFICQDQSIKQLNDILATNQNTSNILNTFASRTFGINSNPTQGPQVQQVR